ncbi:esterase B1-like [Tribolium madens]|uniref:esterase B1-like n=1 Tax=Tribolium madens TaxID=41895 RepID=UPI001CF76116|nr:esterase B1-like [Tribolium madens]
MASLVITLEEGQIRGKKDEDYLGKTYYSFLGVPYAKAPIGELRFKAPVAVESWNGILDATKEGPACPSRHMIFTNYMGCEDNCLNLNVFTPQLPNDNNSGSLKPVMVWIHGGGFLMGSNQKELYGPDYLITEDTEEQVQLLVAINYRLGVFGFLSLEDASLEVPGNAGLKDMVLALKWVQKNIKNFGGDPNNVTIFGESAGGAAVHFLYLSPKTKGLFHKAIVQSGSALNLWARGCSNALEIAKNLGYKETDEKNILEYLKSLPAKKIVDAQLKTPDPFNASTIRPYGPVVEKNVTDSSFLTEEPIDIIKSGRFNHVPLITGYTSREGMLFELIKLGQKEASDLNLENEIYYDLNLERGSEKSQKIAASIKEKYFDNKEPTENDLDKVWKLKTDVSSRNLQKCLQSKTNQ